METDLLVLVCWWYDDLYILASKTTKEVNLALHCVIDIFVVVCDLMSVTALQSNILFLCF